METNRYPLLEQTIGENIRERALIRLNMRLELDVARQHDKYGLMADKMYGGERNLWHERLQNNPKDRTAKIFFLLHQGLAKSRQVSFGAMQGLNMINFVIKDSVYFDEEDRRYRINEFMLRENMRTLSNLPIPHENDPMSNIFEKRGYYERKTVIETMRHELGYDTLDEF